MTRTLFLAAAVAAVAAVSCPAFAADAPLTLVRTIELKGVDGKLDHLAVDAKGERLFVANKPNNTLDVVDLKTGKLVKQIAGQGKVSGVAHSADLDMVYAANGAGTCNGFSGADCKPAFSTKAPNADNVHYDPATKLVYVGCGDSLAVLDAKTGEAKAPIKLPGSVHGFEIDSAAGRIFAVLTKPSLVGVVDLAKGEVTGKHPLTLSDAGSPVAYASADGLLFVGCPKKPMVVVFDAKTGKELAGVEIPGGVDDVHYDAKLKRLYASCGDGALCVVEKKGDKYEVAAKLETPKSSRTCAFGDGRLYLGVPKQPGREGPEIRVYEAK